MRIIIADDEITTRYLLRAMLTAAGHEVLEAVDGEAAWVLIQREEVSLLITDWLMPRLDGPGLIQRIRASGQARYIYTILLSARDSKPDIVAGLNGGADDYLTKPVHADELRARVAIGVRILALELSLREARDRYAYQASHDPLTGLLNRIAITDHVKAELSRANREGYPLGLALLDLDHFKQVNDQYGHLVGDQALSHIAQIVSHTVRPYDWVGRWGGEEFLVVLAKTDLAVALIIAERIRIQIATNPLQLTNQPPLSLTVSVGVACTGLALETAVDPIQLFQQADAALYTAKERGRNCIYPAPASVVP
ncbi:MAG: GGDEF domain-containing protein [Oscillochloridaceae bacterium umkhey_bin13]